MDNIYKAAAWFAAALLLGFLLIFIGNEWALPGSTTALAISSFGYKIIAASLAVVTLRLAIKAFDEAIGLDFNAIMDKTAGASHAIPIFLFSGLRIIGLCILFAHIFGN